MKTVVPDPPVQNNVASFVDAQAAERAFAHYEKPPQRAAIAAPRLNTEEALNNVHSILRSAAATAYESADQLTGTPRQLAMASVHLIELAQTHVDSLIEHHP